MPPKKKKKSLKSDTDKPICGAGIKTWKWNGFVDIEGKERVREIEESSVDIYILPCVK